MDTTQLKRVFYKVEGMSTAAVLSLPSSLTRDMAKEAADKVDMGAVVKEAAVMISSRVADAMLQAALRPADYADLRDISDALVEKLIERLAEKPEEFFNAFSQQLKALG